MIYYFKKRKNFNRIKKLIKTKPIRKITGIHGFPFRTIYAIDFVYIYQDAPIDTYIYAVKEDGKDVYLDFFDNMLLFNLAKERYRFNNSFNNLIIFKIMEIKLSQQNIEQIIKIKKLIKREESLIDFSVEHDDITTEKIRSCGTILEREVKDFFNNFEL
jgi:hypothetical protein